MKKILIGLASILILIVIALYITTRPTKTANGTYSPSPLALKLATSATTNFDSTTYENKYTGNKKVLMICTEERNMTMANGKKFSTGNHPVEMLLPVLHLKNAGFDVDVVTPTGKPVAGSARIRSIWILIASVAGSRRLKTSISELCVCVCVCTCV